MKIYDLMEKEIEKAKETKTYKREVILDGPQGGRVFAEGKEVVMLASNNYLGLADHEILIDECVNATRKYGLGMASVRFICGTQTTHKELEKKIATFLNKQDSILYLSCFSANEGFFASICNESMSFEEWQDVIYSDALNHASIIDGIRLCSSKHTVKRIYPHGDVDALKEMLEEDKEKDFRFRIIATDGVFSMEGDLAPLDRLVELKNKYNALLFMDDSHGIGVIGETGRGTAEVFGLLDEIDVISGTLGKAIGGAMGGFIAANAVLVEYLRQKSRPYTFSNSMPPGIVMAAKKTFEILESSQDAIKRLKENTEYFRENIKKAGFKIIDGIHPIVPVMVYEASVAMDMSEELLKEGVYVKGLWFPVVPKGQARLRVQISAAHTKEDLDFALDRFTLVGKRLGVI